MVLYDYMYIPPEPWLFRSLSHAAKVLRPTDAVSVPFVKRRPDADDVDACALPVVVVAFEGPHIGAIVLGPGGPATEETDRRKA